MKHLQTLSRIPRVAAEDIPTTILIQFKVDVLQALQTLFLAKETAQGLSGMGLR